MPAKKAAKKVSGLKATSTKPPKLSVPIQPLYAVPIYAAAKRGDAAEMKSLAAQARKHISDLTAALSALDKKLGK